ncbi:MAG: hypothetical protein RIB60_04295 [Phycisphaerales bacterium]
MTQQSNNNSGTRTDGRMSPASEVSIYDDIRDRLKQVFEHRTYREIGDLTGVHPETVRRYMLEGRCSVAFLNQVAECTLTNGDWLLTGRGYRQLEKDARDMSSYELLALLTESQRNLEEQVARADEEIAALQSEIGAIKSAAAATDPNRAVRIRHAED